MDARETLKLISKQWCNLDDLMCLLDRALWNQVLRWECRFTHECPPEIHSLGNKEGRIALEGKGIPLWLQLS